MERERSIFRRELRFRQLQFSERLAGVKHEPVASLGIAENDFAVVFELEPRAVAAVDRQLPFAVTEHFRRRRRNRLLIAPLPGDDGDGDDFAPLDGNLLADSAPLPRLDPLRKRLGSAEK